MQLAAQREERKRLAQFVQQKLVQELGRNNRGVKEQNLSVLRNTEMPSILTEVAFVSNPEEDRLLQQPDFRKRAAQAIAAGIMEYLD
ncbi:MAG: N-acetylmuramoyl-L-alanine amidase family protein [Bacillota bacterium]